MHLRDSGCVRTLRPLFVYATGQGQTSKRLGFDRVGRFAWLRLTAVILRRHAILILLVCHDRIVGEFLLLRQVSK